MSDIDPLLQDTHTGKEDGLFPSSSSTPFAGTRTRHDDNDHSCGPCCCSIARGVCPRVAAFAVLRSDIRRGGLALNNNIIIINNNSHLLPHLQCTYDLPGCEWNEFYHFCNIKGGSLPCYRYFDKNMCIGSGNCAYNDEAGVCHSISEFALLTLPPLIAANDEHRSGPYPMLAVVFT